MSLHTALLTGSKGIETALPTMPPKPRTGWDSQRLSLQHSQAGLNLGACTSQGARPSLNLLFHPVSSWCPLCSGSADNQVLGTKLCPGLDSSLPPSPSPLCKGLLIQRTEGFLGVTLTPSRLK